MVTERTQEDKPTKQAQGSRTVSVALSGEHAERLRRVAQTYELEPDELVTYLLMREELPLHGCVQCQAGVDRIEILNRRITNQRRELSRLNHAIAQNAFGRSKQVESRAVAAMASFDRLLALFSDGWQAPLGEDDRDVLQRAQQARLAWTTVDAARRILARFIKGGYPSWAVFTEADLQQVRFPADVLPMEDMIEW